MQPPRMPAATAAAECRTAPDKYQAQSAGFWTVTALPHPLLELVLIACTSVEDKKALRQTCRHFKQILDYNLSCIVPVLVTEDSLLCAKSLLKRIQSAQGSKTILHTACFQSRAMHLNISSLLVYLPESLTRLQLQSYGIDFSGLGGLRNLQSLDLGGIYDTITGMPCVQGITFLCCNRPLSVAHLAPTLKHLQTRGVSCVQGLNELSNLEVLDVWDDMPATFFETHSRLPFRHLCISPVFCKEFFSNSKDWELAPRSLTCLTLRHAYETYPNLQPTNITSVRLMFIIDQTVERAIRALPGLEPLGYIHGLRIWTM